MLQIKTIMPTPYRFLIWMMLFMMNNGIFFLQLGTSIHAFHHHSPGILHRYRYHHHHHRRHRGSITIKPRWNLCQSEGDDNNNYNDNNKETMDTTVPNVSRRNVVLGTTAALTGLLAYPVDSNAEFLTRIRSGGRGGVEKKSSWNTVIREQITVDFDELSSEYCLLKLLPVNNPVFRELQKRIEQVSVIRLPGVSKVTAWQQANDASASALEYLDSQSKESNLRRVFNEDDSAYMQILKEEKFEVLVDTLRTQLKEMVKCASISIIPDNDEVMMLQSFDDNINNAPSDMFSSSDEEKMMDAQRKALIALADVGELLVPQFPYKVPEDGKYANLPRLLGRCKVTFSFARNNKPLGDVTIIADGFAAPLTAGNFIDLCLRNFYPGLPIVKKKKDLNEAPIIEQIERRSSIFADTLATITDKFERTIADRGSLVEFPVVMGSYKEGFVDPLTARARHIPLEVVRLQKSAKGNDSSANIEYSASFASESLPDELDLDDKPVLNFDIPGIVALNHPDQFPNSGSSEFFVIPNDMLDPEYSRLMNGRYAPFGYIIDGYDILQTLRPGDVISNNSVDDFGVYNLKKIKGSSLTDLMGGGDEEVIEE